MIECVRCHCRRPLLRHWQAVKVDSNVNINYAFNNRLYLFASIRVSTCLLLCCLRHYPPSKMNIPFVHPTEDRILVNVTLRTSHVEVASNFEPFPKAIVFEVIAFSVSLSLCLSFHWDRLSPSSLTASAFVGGCDHSVSLQSVCLLFFRYDLVLLWCDSVSPLLLKRKKMRRGNERREGYTRQMRVDVMLPYHSLVCSM